MGNALDAIKTSGKVVGYVRVSSTDQNTVRQLDGIQLDKVFVDKMSGSKSNRPELLACLEYLREDDTLMVHSMDRLARNLDDLRRIVRDLVDRGVAVRFVKENMTFSPKGNSIFDQLMLTMLGAFAEFERNMSRERQREGIEKAKERKAFKGKQHTLNPDQVKLLRAMVADGIPKTKVAERFGIARTTVYDYLPKVDHVQGQQTSAL